jgi:hypothetical protein
MHSAAVAKPEMQIPVMWHGDKSPPCLLAKFDDLLVRHWGRVAV